jgi:hypothetical protein
MSSLSLSLIISFYYSLSVAIYGIIMAIILQGKLGKDDPSTTLADTMFAGIAVFWGGMTVGLGNLFCGYALSLSCYPFPPS